LLSKVVVTGSYLPYLWSSALWPVLSS